MRHRATSRLVQIASCLALALTGSVVGGLATESAMAALGGTDVSGSLTTDTTWTAANGPYRFVGTVDVPAGIVLTIEPGTQLTKGPGYLPGPLLRVGGTVQTQGTDVDPVQLSLAAGEYAQLLGPAPGQSASVIRLSGLATTGTPAIWDGSASFAEFTVTDSDLQVASVNLDNATGDITFARNTVTANGGFPGSASGLNVANPRPGHITVSDNRFRDSVLACRGAGRLTASGNTFERSAFSGSRVSSADDCLLDVSRNNWEVPDSQIGSRVDGSARVVVTPTVPAPSAATPALMPAANFSSRSTNPQGFATLNVSTSSDGGLSTNLVAIATNRETGQVVERHTRPQPSWRTSTNETFTFTQLVPGTLYRLSSYAENALGASVLRETESFIAPTPTGPGPDEAGTAVGGALDQDTTWTAANGPYVFGSPVSVPESVTLTIEPGVVLQAADPYYWSNLFDVAGVVLVRGSSSSPVTLKPALRSSLTQLFVSASPSARVVASGLRSESRMDSFGSPPASRFAEFTLTDSVVTGSMSIDNSSGDVTLLRNAFLGSFYGPNSVVITNPRPDHVQIEHNRFRSGGLSCGGAGRLAATGNTFERTSTLASNDDCVVNAVGNFWEATDSDAASRIQGRSRVTFLPTVDAPSEATPTLAPAQHSQFDSIDESGRATLSVSPGSDGGLPSAIVATATNRETGVVEATKTSPVGSWRTNNTATFVFDELTPGGLYRLSSYVENALGRSLLQESQSFLAPQRAPSAPRDVAATGSGTSATVTWTAPATDNGNAVTGYTVTAQPNGESVTVGPEARSAVFADLLPSTTYSFIVTASSAAGTSVASSPSNAITTAAPPSTGGGGGGGTTPPPPTPPTPTPPPVVVETEAPEAPTNVVSAPGDGSATVSWSPGDDNGSAVTNFTVTRFPGGTAVTAAGNARSVVVTGLTNGTAYTFVVTATNAVGTSSASAPSSPVVPAGRPGRAGEVAATRGDRSATVRWSPADPNGSPVTGYTVTVSPGGATVAVGPQQTSAVVTGLSNGVAYTFSVTATNGVGDGLTSTTAAVTPAGVPGRVLKPRARLQGTGAVVTWTAPSSNGDPITGYVVTMSTGRTFTLGASTRKVVLRRVAVGTRLRFTVRAVNELGSGRASEWSNVVVRKRS